MIGQAPGRSPSVFPPPPPDRRALTRALCLASLAHLPVALLLAFGPSIPSGSRPAAFLGFAAAASLVVLGHAWARASRAGGLSGAAPGLLTAAATLGMVAAADPGLTPRLLAVPANLAALAGFALLALRSHRVRCLPAWSLAAGLPYLASALWLTTGTAPGETSRFLATLVAALAWWCLLAGANHRDPSG